MNNTPDWPALIAAADALARDLRAAAASAGYRPRPTVGVAPPCPVHGKYPAGRCPRCEAEAVKSPGVRSLAASQRPQMPAGRPNTAPQV